MSNVITAESHLQRERVQMARQHIFAVDGAPPFLELVRALFEAEQYNVTTTNFVPQTFDQIAAARPDLIIVDLVLGYVAGWDLLTQLHQEASTVDIPLILTSTNPKLFEWADADIARYGQHRVIVKPFDIDDLVRTVIDLIGPS